MASKVLITNLAIFFLCHSKQFLPISFHIQLLEYFPQKTEGRNKDKSRTDEVVITQINHRCAIVKVVEGKSICSVFYFYSNLEANILPT